MKSAVISVGGGSGPADLDVLLLVKKKYVRIGRKNTDRMTAPWLAGESAMVWE
jgi:hypothetical protein